MAPQLPSAEVKQHYARKKLTSALTRTGTFNGLPSRLTKELV